MDPTVMLLYVMIEHPSLSQTFVVTEAHAMGASGIPVVGYALQEGAAREPAARLEFIAAPPTRRQLVAAAAGGWKRIARVAWRAKRQRASVPEVLRLILAEAHARYALPAAQAARVTHVHAHFLGRSSDVAQTLAEQLGCRWTATAHGADAYAPREPELLRRRLGSVAGVACANQEVEKAILAGDTARVPSTRVVHCGVDLAVLEFKEMRVERGAQRVITIGRLVPTKGHWTILDAAMRLMSRHEGLLWTIVGAGQLLGPLRADPRCRALEPRLQLTGPMDHALALERLAEASAFVLPCEPDAQGGSDGIPVALMEAMALGIPVVTTHVGGISELVVDKVTGFIVTPKDPEALARAVEAILYGLDAEILQDLCRGARTRVEHEFNVVRERERLTAFLQELGVLPR